MLFNKPLQLEVSQGITRIARVLSVASRFWTLEGNQGTLMWVENEDLDTFGNLRLRIELEICSCVLLLRLWIMMKINRQDGENTTVRFFFPPSGSFGQSVIMIVAHIHCDPLLLVHVRHASGDLRTVKTVFDTDTFSQWCLEQADPSVSDELYRIREW